MKTPSRTFTYVALAVATIVAVISLRAFGMASRQQTRTGYKFDVSIHGIGRDEYLKLKVTQDSFDDKLIKLKAHGGDHNIKFLCKDGERAVESYKPNEPFNLNSHPKCQIRTAKVTKYEGANIAAVDASAANDPNAIQHLYSNDAADIDAVLKCFQ
jgi:hypothetical protein